MPRPSILLVDYDPDIHALMAKVVSPELYELDSAYDGKTALERLEKRNYDVVVTDIYMPELDGLELLQRIQQLSPETPVVVMTGQNTPENVARSIREKAFSYFSKPFSSSVVIDIVTQALESRAAPDDIEVLSARPDWISLELRCKLSIADRLVPFFREMHVGLTADEQEEIATAFRELLINAIEHGGHSNPSLKVQVTYIRTARAVLYSIRDPGPGFSFEDLAHAAVANSPETPLLHTQVRRDLGMRPGGFGIFMTRQLADELIYNEKGNEVLLVKYLPAFGA